MESVRILEMKEAYKKVHGNSCHRAARYVVVEGVPILWTMSIESF